MSLIALEESGKVERLRAQPGLAYWIAGSIALHVLALLWLLLVPEQEPPVLWDRKAQDRPPMELVIVQPPQPASAPAPDVKADAPRLPLPPRDETPVFETVDRAALERFLAREADREKIQTGMGMSWTTCSMLTPERRAMEPACDGHLLKHTPGAAVAVSLVAPDGETLEIVRRIEKELEAKAAAAIKSSGEDTVPDASYRNPADAVHGSMRPWEGN